ncbi:YncE family protein [Flavobacterium silvaticum]|uniref:YncE family protein n=1 Tax=Flavobacterium silvaticum TaxID=1852020 RepID=A0A972FUX8_9FLAO|nr:YncE family protein [Flavobacterium silvaticum]NMH28522.1 YncE family protein [Flavobacterium silvaticum]
MNLFSRFSLVLIFVTTISFSQNKHYTLILSKGDRKVQVLDYNTLETVASIPVGNDSHEVVTSDDGSFAYVSNPEMNNNGHEIDIINLKDLSPESQIDTRPFYIPHGLAYQKNKLWFTAQGSKSVALYNLSENKIEGVLGTGQDFTHLIYVTKDGNTFYTTNVESGTVSIFEKKEIPPYMPPTGILPANAKLRNEWRQTLVSVGVGAEGFDVSADGKELWTSRPDGKIVVVDLEKKEVKFEIDTKVLGLHRLKITPDGKSVCIVSVKTGDLLFYGFVSHKLEKQMNIGRGAGIYIDSDNRMFVSCTPDNSVVVIDLKTREVIRKVDVARPDGITSVIVK